MINIPFNPFGRELDEIIPADLARLQDVAEGWYVEYKGGLVEQRKIGKSLAAFANHYGGWIIYGIESAKGTNTPAAFPGLASDEVTKLLERLRNAAKDTVTPSPFYETRTLDGPCPEIGLVSGKSIIVVAVPSGPDAPYIHSDGKIYRRVADASDPKPETDRFILDQLWQRRQQARDRLRSFLEQEPVLSEGESGLSYIDLFLLPDPLGVSGQRAKLTFSRFVELMSDPNSPGLNVAFDNFFAMAGGGVCRAVHQNDPYQMCFTWRFFSNGFSWISIPLPSASRFQIEHWSWLNGYEQEAEMLELIKRGSHDDSQILDLNQLSHAVISAIGQQRRLMKDAEIEGPLYAKASLHNIWRRIPFIDTETFICFAQKYGLPVIQFDEEVVPPGTSYEDLRLVSDMKPLESDEPSGIQALSMQVEAAIPLIIDINGALGLPVEAVFGTEVEREEKLKEVIVDWWSAAERAPKVHGQRTARSQKPFSSLE